jgi:nucleoside-diphosphate-sugar epimerase
VAVEKLVIKLGKTNKDKLSTYVVASGLTYGCGEDIFHFFFKAAWLGDVPALPVFGNGQNIVPTIHIQDLARYTAFVEYHWLLNKHYSTKQTLSYLHKLICR